jgi:hypothetical protein
MNASVIPVGLAKVKIEQILAAFIPNQDINARSRRNYRQALEQFLC